MLQCSSFLTPAPSHQALATMLKVINLSTRHNRYRTNVVYADSKKKRTWGEPLSNSATTEGGKSKTPDRRRHGARDNTRVRKPPFFFSGQAQLRIATRLPNNST